MPYGDEVVAALGRLLRNAHDAQEGFVPPPEPGWERDDSYGGDAEIVGHGDLFWTNVIFREGRPAALIDWEIARPMTRTLEVALAATYWAGLRIDSQLIEWGLPLDRRGERLRLLCDAYGLDDQQRSSLIDELIRHRRKRLDQREWRGVVPREIIVANCEWTEAHAERLGRYLDWEPASRRLMEPRRSRNRRDRPAKRTRQWLTPSGRHSTKDGYGTVMAVPQRAADSG